MPSQPVQGLPLTLLSPCPSQDCNGLMLSLLYLGKDQRRKI